MIRGWCYNFYEPEVKTLTKRWLYVNGLEHFDLVNVAYLSLHSPILWNGSYDYAIDNSINELRPRHTMRQIAATNRCDMSPRQVAATNRLVWHVKIIVAATEFCRCDLLHKFKLVWICATYHSDKLSTSDLLQQQCRRGDLSPWFVASCVSAFTLVTK